MRSRSVTSAGEVHTVLDWLSKAWFSPMKQFSRQNALRILLAWAMWIASMGWLAAGETFAAASSSCPFCSAVAATFTENIEANQVVVFARLVQPAPEIEDDEMFLPKAEFEISTIHKGKEFVDVGQRFKALLVGKYDVGQMFLVMGVDPPDIVWSTPLKANQNLMDYIDKLDEIPREGADRLAFFLPYLEHEDAILTYDAYDEFARCKYSDLHDLKDRLDPAALMKWIADPDVPINRRRLYFTMLGVCGRPEDAEELERLIRSGDREKQAGLDALVASYLTLVGDRGMDVVDECFLKSPDADDLQLLSVKAALTFHASEAKILSRDRVIQSLRTFLDRPAIADAVLPDLSRLEDWGAAERVAKLFDELETNFQKVMVVQFLQTCPRPEAKTFLQEIEQKAPDVIKKAKFLNDFDLGDGGQTEATPPEKTAPTSTPNPFDDEDAEQPSDTTVIVTHKPAAFADISVPTTEAERSVAKSTEEQQTFTVNRAEPTAPANVEKKEGEPPVAGPDTAASAAKLNRKSAPAASFRLGVVVITLPMIVSFGVFLLIWSVISGWFERLIF